MTHPPILSVTLLLQQMLKQVMDLIRQIVEAGSDPGETHESRPPPEQDEDQAGPNPGISQDPLSSTGTLSSMKNLEDAYAIGDQFINDKYTKDEPGKLNVEAEVVSMVTVPIYQASSSAPPLFTPVIDLSPPKPASSTTQAPIFTTTTMTTTTTLPPPLQQQSTTESELAEHVTALEKKFSDLEQNNKNLDNTTQNLGSRVYTLELRDLPYKIDEAVRENVKEAVQIALQAPLRERFRDLSEEDIKEMLHQRMFESGTYKSLPEHIALYKALEASMKRAQRDKFLAEKDKLRKQRHDDQDPPPPPLPDSDLTTTYQTPPENSLLEKSRDMRTFMNWYCQQKGKTELTQADFEGQAYELVKAFYLDVGSGQALLISKMKAACYLDFRLELLVPEPMYNYLKEITLRRADYQEYMIAEKDFKNMYPSDFEDLNLRLLQGWDAKGFEYKHDYTIIESPRAVVFPVGNNEWKIMRFNEIYKLSDGTLTNIIEALDYKVKEYKTEIELELEQTQQGSSHEVSVSTEGVKE
ncbi:hypothetical protein Tco_0719150 [Tanacetum coccineum]